MDLIGIIIYYLNNFQINKKTILVIFLDSTPKGDNFLTNRSSNTHQNKEVTSCKNCGPELKGF
jgi:hypothetical protein